MVSVTVVSNSISVYSLDKEVSDITIPAIRWINRKESYSWVVLVYEGMEFP